jgi:methionine sulfoxide reductase heme-binding subunit
MTQHLWWYTVRASGFVAWALVAGSVLWGLLLSARATRRPSPAWVRDLHRFLGGLACLFVLLHVGALFADTFVGWTVVDVLVPYATRWRPGGVALGIVALYLLFAVELTSLAMRHLPRRLWHAVHLLSFVVFAAVTAHALLAGTDTAEPAARWFAIVTSTMAAILLTVRVGPLVTRSRRADSQARVHSGVFSGDEHLPDDPGEDPADQREHDERPELLEGPTSLEDRGREASSGVHRGVVDRDAHQVDEGEHQTDGEAGEADRHRLPARADDDEHEQGGEHDLGHDRRAEVVALEHATAAQGDRAR